MEYTWTPMQVAYAKFYFKHDGPFTDDEMLEAVKAFRQSVL